ncbi:Cytochrome c5 [Marinobacterium lacunae]|uniref:Cytochrome c5 n=1 Tax=Marinobacterium lacunae TaxID=1232683 RepID=A0A081FW44_9GAMM|nr:c-type cytochrome [Marinobacterium lacunae]KEA62749.1 Cytochrome c5 [Marinobacterium lacunae]MBR9882159.1 cytochrome c5 family protein [Oceanospirillales bacterium]
MNKAVLGGFLSLVVMVSAQSANAQTAEETVAKHCQACHDSGLGGAPKLGDQAAWAPRIEKGVDGMLATVLSGKGAMPPKGTCMGCSDDDLRAAISLMSGGAQ